LCWDNFQKYYKELVDAWVIWGKCQYWQNPQLPIYSVY